MKPYWVMKNLVAKKQAKDKRASEKKEVHVFSAAFTEQDLKELLTFSDHVVFNSFAQWQRFQPLIQETKTSADFGLRINPMHSEGATPIYDPVLRVPGWESRTISLKRMLRLQMI